MKKSFFLQVFLILIIVLTYFTLDFNKVFNLFKKKNELVTLKDCDLHEGPCSIQIQDGRIFTLEIFPKTIPLMKELTFKITSSDKSIKKLDLKIYSQNMFMGEFNLAGKKTKDGIFEIKSFLPTCPVGKMIWNADLNIDSIGAKFIFITE